ncbi:hypothetical protein M408DRAFT_8384 [Serendipita vermifera MAFF 305830]|uniref:Pop1 N-terminal domain-containing protein n=1 Tax=Serendipita vermifera MAFF 305830 TaxID=933852 RepID=A0A0C3AWN6_SERVB|nr:hypothetical protein M408DRAFT_8384 [Serendipita vermifera MAFF 305830]
MPELSKPVAPFRPQCRQIPVSVDAVKFAESRAFEINAMQKAIKSVRAAASTRVWQSLPRHLRRRAASHNVRRVPVRLREKARQEMDPVKKKTLKRFIAKISKSKKQSRTDMLLKRQRHKRWLETHIWHAKRMKMIETWGYRLALHPTEKSFRPSHRAVLHGCILHDSSYTATIELKGPLEVLKQVFGRISDPQDVNPAAARYVNGSRICETQIFEDAAYPLAYIAPAHVMWLAQLPSKGDHNQQDSENRGNNKSLENARAAWLRVHPAAYEKTSQALTNAVMAIMESERKQGRSSVSVEIADLRGQFNSFDLMGPKSSQVIWGAIAPVKQHTFDTKKHFWNSLRDLRTPGSCPRGMIIGLEVHDPRLSFPPKNATIREENYDASTIAFTVQPTSVLSTSDLWSEKTRLDLSKPKFRKRDLDERKSKQLIPGMSLAPLKEDDRIPIIMIQKSLIAPTSTPGTKGLPGPTMHGWTIITPLGWGMPFLTSLIFTGSRVGGLREVKSQAIESGLPYFPDDFSGCDLGRIAQSSIGNEAKAKWDRTPPANRPSFAALGTRSPFEPDWEVVCGIQPNPRLEAGFAATQRAQENPVTVWLLHGQNVRQIVADLLAAEDPAAELLQSINAARSSRDLPLLNLDAQDLYRGALLLIKATMCGRGTPSDMSAIYEVSVDEAVAWSNQGKRPEKEAYEIFKRKEEPDRIIGYITSGRQSLNCGKGIGIGSVSLAKFVESIRSSG